MISELVWIPGKSGNCQFVDSLEYVHKDLSIPQRIVRFMNHDLSGSSIPEQYIDIVIKFCWLNISNYHYAQSLQGNLQPCRDDGQQLLPNCASKVGNCITGGICTPAICVQIQNIYFRCCMALSSNWVLTVSLASNGRIHSSQLHTESKLGILITTFFFLNKYNIIYIVLPPKS